MEPLRSVEMGQLVFIVLVAAAGIVGWRMLKREQNRVAERLREAENRSRTGTWASSSRSGAMASASRDSCRSRDHRCKSRMMVLLCYCATAHQRTRVRGQQASRLAKCPCVQYDNSRGVVNALIALHTSDTRRAGTVPPPSPPENLTPPDPP